MQVCQGKIAYPTPQKAHAAANDQNRYGTRGHKFAYRCKECKQWHLTSQKQNR